MQLPFPRTVLLLILITSLLTVSCRSKGPEKTKVRKRSARYLLKKADQNKPAFNTLSSKAKMQYILADGNKQSFTANIRMKQDSAIWISITPLLGIEMARAMVTPDQIRVMDRLNRKYYEYSAKDMARLVGYPVDFNLLQAAMTGDLLLPFKRPKSGVKQDYPYLEELAGDIYTSVMFRSNDYRYSKMKMMDARLSRNLEVEFDEYQDYGKYTFPNKRTVKVMADDKYQLNIQFTKLKFDESLDFPFTVSSRYEKVD